MDKTSILDDFLEFAKERHEKGKCDCKKREDGCEKEQRELSSDELQQLKNVFEKVTKEGGSGFILAKSGSDLKFCAREINRFEIMASLISALGNVIEGTGEKMRPKLVNAAADAIKLFYGVHDQDMPENNEKLPDTFRAVIERHSSGECGCTEEDRKNSRGCRSGEDDLILGVREVANTILEKEGRGVMVMRDMKNDKQRVVLRGVNRIETIEFLTTILAEILRETGDGENQRDLVDTVKNVIEDIVYGEND